jgi:hypothetical protein
MINQDMTGQGNMENLINMPKKHKIKSNGVLGAATNDADYKIQVHEDEDVWDCPYYKRWKNMLERCYLPIYQKKNPAYIGCTVCDEWLWFSKFRSWMEKQDWKDKELDKDILFIGNKIYSPETCVFLHEKVNSFTTDSLGARGEYPLGVYFHKSKGKFMASCSNPFTLKIEYLGLFTCPEEAHQAWKARKHELAVQLADSKYVNDSRVAEALKVRYS